MTENLELKEKIYAGTVTDAIGMANVLAQPFGVNFDQVYNQMFPPHLDWGAEVDQPLSLALYNGQRFLDLNKATYPSFLKKFEDFIPEINFDGDSFTFQSPLLTGKETNFSCAQFNVLHTGSNSNKNTLLISPGWNEPYENVSYAIAKLLELKLNPDQVPQIIIYIPPYQGVRSEDPAGNTDRYLSSSPIDTRLNLQNSALEFFLFYKYLLSLDRNLLLLANSAGNIPALLAMMVDKGAGIQAYFANAAVFDLAKVVYSGIATARIAENLIRKGVSEKDLAAMLADVDPLNYLRNGLSLNTRVEQIIYRFDGVVSTEIQQHWASMMGTNPKFFPTGHVGLGANVLNVVETLLDLLEYTNKSSLFPKQNG